MKPIDPAWPLMAIVHGNESEASERVGEIDVEYSKNYAQDTKVEVFSRNRNMWVTICHEGPDAIEGFESPIG